MNVIAEDDLMDVYSMQLGYKKADNFVLLEADSSILAMIPEDFARTNRVLAVSKKGIRS